ncbi:hypothetical protein M885DRAFT_47520 [Pelagophyceae sp. CCMP2097]|nr:hypothetical protein M885DRAFT_47520 [Pelagophyceae sp. CCMP2097]
MRRRMASTPAPAAAQAAVSSAEPPSCASYPWSEKSDGSRRMADFSGVSSSASYGSSATARRRPPPATKSRAAAECLSSAAKTEPTAHRTAAGAPSRSRVSVCATPRPAKRRQWSAARVAGAPTSRSAASSDLSTTHCASPRTARAARVWSA